MVEGVEAEGGGEVAEAAEDALEGGRRHEGVEERRRAGRHGRLKLGYILCHPWKSGPRSKVEDPLSKRDKRRRRRRKTWDKPHVGLWRPPSGASSST